MNISIEKTFNIEGEKFKLLFFSEDTLSKNISEKDFKLILIGVIKNDTSRVADMESLPLDFIIIIERVPFNQNQSNLAIYFISGPREVTSLYFRISNQLLESYSTRLIDLTLTSDNISSEYFHYFISNGLGLGQFDRNKRFLTPFEEIQKLPAQTFIKFYNGRKIDERTIPFQIKDGFSSVDEARDYARTSFSVFIKHLSEGKRIAVEASGGIDSSLIVSYLSDHKAENHYFGVAAQFPYYEARYERVFRNTLSENFNIKILENSGCNFLAYSLLDEVEYHSEPAWDSVGYGSLISLYNITQQYEAKALYSGHAADYVFCLNPNNFPQVQNFQLDNESKKFFRGFLSEKLKACAIELSKEYRENYNFFGGDSSWLLACLEPNYFNKYLKRKNGDFYRGSPFISKEFLSAIHYVSKNFRLHEHSVQKPIAYYLFSDKLPECFWKRKGKLDHSGLQYRGARIFRGSLLSLIQEQIEFLEVLGINTSYLSKHIIDVTNNRCDSSDMLNGILACAIWKRSYDKEIKDIN